LFLRGFNNDSGRFVDDEQVVILVDDSNLFHAKSI
jgi:hypothetical protein